MEENPENMDADIFLLDNDCPAVLGFWMEKDRMGGFGHGGSACLLRPLLVCNPLSGIGGFGSVFCDACRTDDTASIPDAAGRHVRA